jgi:hypothetical protein
MGVAEQKCLCFSVPIAWDMSQQQTAVEIRTLKGLCRLFNEGNLFSHIQSQSIVYNYSGLTPWSDIYGGF